MVFTFRRSLAIICASFGYWRIKGNRIRETRQLVKKLRKDPKNVRALDFRNNRIEELVKKAGGLRNALIEAGFNVEPNTNKPPGYWKKGGNRVRAIGQLVKKLGKDVRDITQKDFFDNESSQLLYYYKCSPWGALKDAGYDINPWEMKRFPITVWKSRKNRIEAVKWLINKLRKKPEDLTYSDFTNNRIYKL